MKKFLVLIALLPLSAYASKENICSASANNYSMIASLRDQGVSFQDLPKTYNNLAIKFHRKETALPVSMLVEAADTVYGMPEYTPFTIRQYIYKTCMA